MDVEKRVLLRGIQFVIEILVVVLFQVGGLASPRGCGVVDNLIAVSINHFLFLVAPLLLLAKGDFDGQELAIFGQQLIDAAVVKELLAVGVDMHNDIGTKILFISIFDSVLGAAVATPFHRLRTFFVRFCDNIDALRNHKRAIESQSEMADNGANVVFVLVEKFTST